MDIRLFVQTGARAGQQVPIDVSEFFIGRDADCHFQIDHPMVEAKHARIHLFGGRITITDLKTENGTAINDKYIRSIELKDADRIKIGPTNFLVFIAEQPKDLDRRVEFWCSNTLEARSKQSLPTDKEESLVESKTSEMAKKILGKLSTREGRTDGRARLRVGESRNITVVKFVDNALVQDTDIMEVEAELTDLIDSGKQRILLNFGNIENMSSQMAGVLIRGHQLCAERAGVLKICKLGSKVTAMMSMLGLDKMMEIFKDERPALESVWPDPPQPKESDEDGPKYARNPLDEIPEDFMPTLPGSAAGLATPPAPAPAPAPPPPPSSATAATRSTSAPATAPARPAASQAVATSPAAIKLRVGLVVEGGKSDGKVVEVRVSRFLIGSDPSCHLRPKSPQVAPIHAIIERRGDRVFVRDEGTEAGTLIAGRTIRGREVEAADGDRLQVGPLSFRFSIARRAASAPAAAQPEPFDASAASWILPGPGTAPEGDASVDDLAANWLLEGGGGINPQADVEAEVAKKLARFMEPETPEADEEDDEPEIPEAPAPPPIFTPRAAAVADEPPALLHLDAEVIQGILIVKILKSDLNDEGTVAPIRSELQSLQDLGMPNRVVLDLEAVRYLSSRAIGMILAYHQRLDRAGGKLRLCQVRPKVLPILQQMRLTMIIQVYPTRDEALLTAW